MSSLARWVVAIALGSLLLTGCSDSGSGSADGSGTTAVAQAPFPAIGIGHPYLGSRPPSKNYTPTEIGPVLVNSAGQTLHVFEKDKRRGGLSVCYRQCAETWPPLTTSEAEVAGIPGIRQDLIGTIRRKDGTMQVTYDRWPLYTLTGELAGHVRVGGVPSFGGKWYLITPGGEVVVR